MRMAFSILPLLMLGIGTAAAQDGASIYNRCAACHTRTGAGVPGLIRPWAATSARSPPSRTGAAIWRWR